MLLPWCISPCAHRKINKASSIILPNPSEQQHQICYKTQVVLLKLSGNFKFHRDYFCNTLLQIKKLDCPELKCWKKIHFIFTCICIFVHACSQPCACVCYSEQYLVTYTENWMYLNKVQLLPAPNKVHGQCCSFLVIFTNGNGLYLQTERALCYFRPSLLLQCSSLNFGKSTCCIFPQTTYHICSTINLPTFPTISTAN